MAVLFLCVYLPNADLCLHRDLHLVNVHHLAVERDGVQSIQIEQEATYSTFLDVTDDLKISCAKHLFCVTMDSCNRGKCKSKRNKK